MQAKDECKGRLRSRNWFDNPANPGMTSIYLERFPNYGLTREEMQSGKPIIGIVDGGSLYDVMSARLMDQGVCIFRNCARGTKALVRYVEARLNADAIRRRQSN